MNTKGKGYTILLFITSLATTAVWLFLFLEGRAYYALSLDERPFHELHRVFKPGGGIGHGLGFLSMFMMIVMHIYTLRKRFRLFQWMGTLSGSLGLHIYLGIAGPMFAVLHTAFKFKGLVGISFWCMIIVMLSGFVGRYFYGAIPRRISGLAYSLSEAKELLEQMEANLQGGAHEDSKAARILEQNKNKLKRKIAIWKTLQNRLHYWHLFHKPFSIVMYIILIVHVMVAWLFGYNWIF